MTICNLLGFDMSSPLTLNEWISYTLYIYEVKVSSYLDFTKNRIVDILYNTGNIANNILPVVFGSYHLHVCSLTSTKSQFSK